MSNRVVWLVIILFDYVIREMLRKAELCRDAQAEQIEVDVFVSFRIKLGE